MVTGHWYALWCDVAKSLFLLGGEVFPEAVDMGTRGMGRGEASLAKNDIDADSSEPS